MQEINYKFIGADKFLRDFAGNSEEESPDGSKLATGSSIFEVDTGSAYFYDARKEKWINPRTGEERGADAQ